jgi:hypothetical protein
MAEKRNERDVIVDHPNRDKAAVKATKGIVILLLLASVALMLIVTIGGWSVLVGMQPVQIGFILVYLLLAFYAARWNRGVLPVAAALAIILLIFAAVAGPEWFARDKPGFAQPDLPANLLGLITLLLVPVQILLIAFAMRGFQHDWHVEVERPTDDHYGRGEGFGPGDPGPQPA